MSTYGPEKIMIENDVDEVCCNGGNAALGHPAVWYCFDGSDTVECLYCDRCFIKKGSDSGCNESTV